MLWKGWCPRIYVRQLCYLQNPNYVQLSIQLGHVLFYILLQHVWSPETRNRSIYAGIVTGSLSTLNFRATLLLISTQETAWLKWKLKAFLKFVLTPSLLIHSSPYQEYLAPWVLSLIVAWCEPCLWHLHCSQGAAFSHMATVNNAKQALKVLKEKLSSTPARYSTGVVLLQSP